MTTPLQWTLSNAQVAVEALATVAFALSGSTLPAWSTGDGPAR